MAENKKRITTKEDFETILKIVERSEEMKIGIGDRFTRLMDIEFAHERFDLRLDDFLNAEKYDFTHDFCGIQARIDRQNLKWEDDCFLPRFASR